MFGPIRKMLKGCRFELEENIKAMVLQWFQQQQLREFFVEGIHQLVCKWVACPYPHGEYF
jgi:hypothetical protein